MRFPEDAEFICIDGWDEALYNQALHWVNGNRRVAFLSEEEKQSSDPKVKIYCMDSPLQRQGMISQIAWFAVQKKMHAIGSFKEEITLHHTAANLLLSEAADFQNSILKNAKENNRPFRRGLELKGAFKGIPALVIGAGPSLEKNAHLLRHFEDKALLFAGGTALNLIDVEPHFAASIDANAPSDLFKKHPFKKTPFCYQARMNRENYSLLEGERILFPDGFSHAINWLYDEEKPFDSGWTVGNFLTAIALHLGCSPIIFVGMDLCYQEGRKYAHLKIDMPDNLIQQNGVWTQSDFLMAARWTEQLAKTHDFIDTSAHGILQIKKQPLQDVLQPLELQLLLRKQVFDAIQKLSIRSASRWDAWQGEIVEEMLLMPLWQIWRPVFEREFGQQNMELHKALFFQRVLAEHG